MSVFLLERNKFSFVNKDFLFWRRKIFLKLEIIFLSLYKGAKPPNTPNIWA